jgi:hypothetical protein
MTTQSKRMKTHIKIVRRIGYFVECLETQEKKYKELEEEWKQLELEKGKIARIKSLSSLIPIIEISFDEDTSVEKARKRAEKIPAYHEYLALKKRQKKIGFSLTYAPGSPHGIGRMDHVTLSEPSSEAAWALERARRARRRLRLAFKMIDRLKITTILQFSLDMKEFRLWECYHAKDFQPFAQWLSNTFDGG